MTVNVNLPKDCDAGRARRIAQGVNAQFGALGTSSLWHIPGGAYGHAVTS
jgi:hypothetical protein